MTTLLTVALAALLAGADPGFDTVFLQNGGRLRGTVVEEDPTRGVTVQIPGGQVRTVPPGEVFRIEYRDGTIGAIGAQPPPPKAPVTAPAVEPGTQAPAVEPAEPPAALAEPAPGAAPAPPPPGWTGRSPGEPIRPLNPGALRPPPGPPRPALIMLSGGLGFMAPSGDAEVGVPMSDLVHTLIMLDLEAGLRFTPELMGSVYLDLGFGGAGGTARAICESFGNGGCSAISAQIGLQLRWSFTPLARQTPWVAVGFGGEATGVAPTDSSAGNDLTYSGREWRLSAGYDFRGAGQLGVGVFLTAGFGTYTHLENFQGLGFDTNEANHTWIQAGVRAILFP